MCVVRIRFESTGIRINSPSRVLKGLKLMKKKTNLVLFCLSVLGQGRIQNRLIKILDPDLNYVNSDPQHCLELRPLLN